MLGEKRLLDTVEITLDFILNHITKVKKYEDINIDINGKSFSSAYKNNKMQFSELKKYTKKKLCENDKEKKYEEIFPCFDADRDLHDFLNLCKMADDISDEFAGKRENIKKNIFKIPHTENYRLILPHGFYGSLHSENTAVLCGTIADMEGLAEKKQLFFLSGYFHDKGRERCNYDNSGLESHSEIGAKKWHYEISPDLIETGILDHTDCEIIEVAIRNHSLYHNEIKIDSFIEKRYKSIHKVLQNADVIEKYGYSGLLKNVIFPFISFRPISWEGIVISEILYHYIRIERYDEMLFETSKAIKCYLEGNKDVRKSAGELQKKIIELFKI